MTSGHTNYYEEKVLGPTLAAIDAATGRKTSLRWTDSRNGLSTGAAVCVVGADGKALSVYMNPETMRKRLQMVARMVGA